MIPVKPKPEPTTFNARVRQKGERWLREQGIDLHRPLPVGTSPEPYWRACIPDLHAAYWGICAYLCVYIELTVGGTSTDHFVAKSVDPKRIYEWSNYRLACTTMNSRKCDYDDVLDPFELKSDTFHLNLASGAIYPNPKLKKRDLARAVATIERLELDDAECRQLRKRRWADYVKLAAPKKQRVAAEKHLRKYSPFVWTEAKRQKLL